MCHPKGRSAAKDARSALTRRPARSYSAPTYPRPRCATPVAGQVNAMSGQFRGHPRCQHPSPTRPIAPQPTHTRLRRAEVQSATSLLQSARLAREGSPLPAGHVEVESHRTPPVLRDQQELGGPTPRQLRDHPEVPAHHTHLHRTEGPRPPGAEDLRDRRQGHRRPNARATHHTEQRHAQVELHHRTHVMKTESIFASTLRTVVDIRLPTAPKPSPLSAGWRAWHVAR